MSNGGGNLAFINLLWFDKTTFNSMYTPEI